MTDRITNIVEIVVVMLPVTIVVIVQLLKFRSTAHNDHHGREVVAAKRRDGVKPES